MKYTIKHTSGNEIKSLSLDSFLLNWFLLKSVKSNPAETFKVGGICFK